MQGVVICVGEESEFGSVFKMMQSEEVRVQRSLRCELTECVACLVGSKDPSPEEHEHTRETAVLLLPLYYR